jgi:hypothetical protein
MKRNYSTPSINVYKMGIAEMLMSTAYKINLNDAEIGSDGNGYGAEEAM